MSGCVNRHFTLHKYIAEPRDCRMHTLHVAIANARSRSTTSHEDSTNQILTSGPTSQSRQSAVLFPLLICFIAFLAHGRLFWVPLTFCTWYFTIPAVESCDCELCGGLKREIIKTILAIAYSRYRSKYQLSISIFHFELPGCAGRVTSASVVRYGACMLTAHTSADPWG